MRLNHPALTVGSIVCLLGMASIAHAAPPPSERAGSSKSILTTIFPWTAETPAAKPAQQKFAAKNTKRTAKKPAPADAAQPDKEAIAQAVREFLTNNQTLLRGAIVDVLRTDPDIQKMLAAKPPEAPQSQANRAPIPADQARVEEIIRNYLMTRPEILQEAIAELEKRQALAESEKHRKAVQEHAELLFNSPRQVVLGNPLGDVAFVEFFDYNCAYCKRALSDMMELMKADPKLKIVLKEFPVLGQNSMEAAQVSTAVRMQDKAGKKYLEFHQRLMLGRGQADKARALAIAKEIGLDMGRLEKDMAGEEARAWIEESLRLAEALGLNGTPSYVVGPNVVIGAVGLSALREKVNTARCGKATC
jgi:protein-disulfide isomerase